ncbi:MAG: MIP/aquaporin family protein, partial [Actinomycetota bacterium]
DTVCRAAGFMPELKHPRKGETLRRYLAEFLATFFLVFAGVGAIVADQQLAVVLVRDSFGPLGIALATGLALTVALAAIGRISGGHANPAVSLAFFVTGRISAKDMAGYIGAQLLGGIAAAFLIKGLFLEAAVSQTGVGVNALGPGVKVMQGLSIEIILTFILTFVIWGTAVDRHGPKNIAPIAIGLTVTAGILIGGPFTGAAMNPARWFGPALASGQFANSLVWVAGPIVGALLASLLYESFFLTDQLPEESLAEIAAAEKVAQDEADFEDDADDAIDEGEWRDTPSPMVPPGPPKPAGDPSPMTPPPPSHSTAPPESEATTRSAPPPPPPPPPAPAPPPPAPPAPAPPPPAPPEPPSSASGE